MIRSLAIIWVIILMALQVGIAQEEGSKNIDTVYYKNVRSVKFHVQGLFLSQPIVDLGSSTRLVLSFDDLDNDVKDFVYTIEHCDRDWKPSRLSEMEFLDGFTGELIEDYRFSFKTTVDYTHYELVLPNEDLTWTKSGNYVLKIFEDGNDLIPVLTRRFMVVEPLVTVQENRVAPNQGRKFNTHHEFDFVVDLKDLKVRSAQQEVRATILQNGRWDNALTDLAPLYERNNQAFFDFQDKVVFPAGKEFRYLDLRSLDYRGEGIYSIEEYEEGYEVIVLQEDSRADKPFINWEDINGNYIIETRDQQNNELAADYANVLFSLCEPQRFDGSEIYIVGVFSDWQLKEEFKMVYNERINCYVSKLFLKQGFYNYAYALKEKGSKASAPLNLSALEGDWHETDNDYTFLIYYRAFGDRYDRLIGAYGFASGRR